ncbi:MAG: efflux RND transporter periplasmic adaptor subunit [Bacteroidales bacterium]|nr:efflux RND transporter periplasmic adaptor subunit [Bacteroidales bacterium]MDD6583125.1 efflux RND transporter periplasmic adaptor subunit [Bacteroidales bacterium]
MRKFLQSTLALTLGLLVTVSCNSKKEETPIPQNEKIKVTIEQVHTEEVEQLYEYTAVVQAEAVNNIAPTIAGRIQKIYVEVGDNVTKGQKLVSMDASNLEQAKTQLDNLEVSFKRLDELYKVGGVSKSDWDATKTQLDVARTNYNNLLTNTTLTSPLNGIVTLRNYDSGDIYAGNPILQVQQIRPVKMNINVSENQYTSVKKGMKASVKMEVFENQEFNGTVTLIYPTIDARTHTFPVEISLPNSNGKVRPGMYARVTMNYGTNTSVVIPDNCIIKQQGSGDRYVYVYKDGKVAYTKVTLGRRMGNRYEILDGVKDGEYVVTTGYTKLNDGMEVDVKNASETISDTTNH